MEKESTLSLGKHNLSSENPSSNFGNTTLLKTEVCLLFCYAVGGKWGGGMTMIWSFLFL